MEHTTRDASIGHLRSVAPAGHVVSFVRSISVMTYLTHNRSTYRNSRNYKTDLTSYLSFIDILHPKEVEEVSPGSDSEKLGGH